MAIELRLDDDVVLTFSYKALCKTFDTQKSNWKSLYPTWTETSPLFEFAEIFGTCFRLSDIPQYITKNPRKKTLFAIEQSICKLFNLPDNCNEFIQRLSYIKDTKTSRQLSFQF